MLKLNLIGNNFIHLSGGNKGYSVHGKESKYIRWVQDFSSDQTFYIDNEINKGLKDNIKGIKYAWLLESKFITPQINKQIKDNPEKYLSVFKYIFTHNQELLKLDDRFKFVPANGTWIKEPMIYPKTKLISMISSNKRITQGHNLRLNWVNKLKNKVDLYGRGFKEIKDKEEGLCDYMFSVAIENGEYPSYFTEKILDCFATGTIPIYLGSPDISNYFNQKGILTLKEDILSNLSKELYLSKMEAIIENLQKVKEITTLEDFIYLNYIKNEFLS